MIVGVGCDIVKLSRMEHLMKKEGHTRFLSDAELSLYHALSETRKCEWLAGRFAAKEAIIKAMGKEHSFLLHDIEVLYDGKQPVCTLPGYQIHVSIAHEQEYAIAYVIAQKEGNCL